MKISYSTMATPELSVYEAIEVAKEYGFDGIDLRIKHNTGEIDEGITLSEAEKIKSVLGTLEISGLMCYNKTIINGTYEMIDSVLKCVKIAEMLNCKAIRIFTGKIGNDKIFHDLVYALKEIFIGYGSGINILVQNHLNNGVTIQQAIKLSSYIKDNRFGLVLSPDQALISGENIIVLLNDIKNICKQIYIADINDKKEFVLIGDGIIPFNKILSNLKENGFDGYITLKWEKCWCEYLENFPIAFKSFLKLINNYSEI